MRVAAGVCRAPLHSTHHGRPEQQDQPVFGVSGFGAGASPYGALEMSGNVWVWTADT